MQRPVVFLICLAMFGKVGGSGDFPIKVHAVVCALLKSRCGLFGVFFGGGGWVVF